MASYRPGQRVALVAGLREFAGKLECCPDLPIPVVPEVRVTGAYRRADVAANDVAHVASLLGVGEHRGLDVRCWFGGLLYSFTAVVSVPANTACTRGRGWSR